MSEPANLRIIIGVAALTSLVVSGGTAWLLGPSSEPKPAAVREPAAKRPAREQPAPSVRGEQAALVTLREALEKERSARLLMAEQINQLREELKVQPSRSEAPRNRVAGRSDAPPALGVETASEFAELWFSDRALRDLGMSQREAEALRRQFDEVELEKLEARDRALREGWSSSSRHSRELREIRTRFREQIGEDNYDRVLYASGRKNRVRVQDLLRGSNAEDSGVEVGDVIVSYAGQRVFDPSALYILTTKGDFGETIRLEVQRDQEILRLVVPRGPLGGKMGHFAAAPGM